MNTTNWETVNKGKAWTDDELTVILSAAPTKANCEKFAKAFKRGYGSIAQIYQWAMTTKKNIKKKRPDDKFINQVKRVAKQVGWF
jgi:predicted secreted protein